ncbi:MAG TPA: hypothetical protein PLH39_06565, partial [Promineifilum sp.]|nr:hypothetical protein [Promineifilum sp.]
MRRIIVLILSLLIMAACRQEGNATPTAAPEALGETATPATAPAPTEPPPTPAPTEEPPALPTAAPTAVPAACNPDDPIYLAIVWHQHQPVYFQDPETGVFSRPWVRLHAAKDYVDMATMLR